MGLRENKLYFEQIFFNGWTATPIHYAGQEFKIDGIDSWINPVYNPLTARLSGLSKFGNFSERGMVDVVCWAKTEADAMQLADDVIAFFGDNVDATKFKLGGYSVQDRGWTDSNMVYVYLSFDVVSYDIKCKQTVWVNGSLIPWVDENNNEWETI